MSGGVSCATMSGGWAEHVDMMMKEVGLAYTRVKDIEGLVMWVIHLWVLWEGTCLQWILVMKFWV